MFSKLFVFLLVLIFSSCSTKEKPAEFKPTYNHNNQYSMRIMGVVPQRLRPYIKTITVTSTYIAHSTKCYVITNSWEGVGHAAEKIYHKTFSVDSRSGKFDGKVYTDLVTPQDKCQWGLSMIEYQFNGLYKTTIAYFSIAGIKQSKQFALTNISCAKIQGKLRCREGDYSGFSKSGGSLFPFNNYTYKLEFRATIDDYS